MTGWVAFANQWQTLISGGLAILAALIGAGFVYHQTRQARLFELDRLGRRHAAARSTLPLVLSSIMEYARAIGRDLRRLYLAAPGNHIQREALIAWEIPPVPQGETAALAEVIEAASNDVADVIADLLGRLQVQAGRLRGLHADVVAGTAGRRNILKSEIDEYIQDIADIHARCELLLDYARRESDTAQPMPLAADKLRALFLMGFHEGAFDTVKATITRRGPSGLPSVVPAWRRAWTRIAAIWKAGQQ